ncbi:MAG TPA: hypothetical protein VH083_01480, partial [Myxococcales bacterium]|nr:hypothetical protein [Myxococcales bacterium]
MERTKIATAALARSDRYLHSFVEALHMCPFARRCREEGKLHRRVLLAGDDALAAIREVEAMPAAAVEVALLIFPEAATGSLQSARDFEALVAGLREAMNAGHEQTSGREQMSQTSSE